MILKKEHIVKDVSLYEVSQTEVVSHKYYTKYKKILTFLTKFVVTELFLVRSQSKS